VAKLDRRLRVWWKLQRKIRNINLLKSTVQVQILSLLLKIKNKTYGNNILDIKYVYGVTLWLFHNTRTKRQESANNTNCSFLFVVYFCNGYVGSNPALTTKKTIT